MLTILFLKYCNVRITTISIYKINCRFPLSANLGNYRSYRSIRTIGSIGATVGFCLGLVSSGGARVRSKILFPNVRPFNGVDVKNTK